VSNTTISSRATFTIPDICDRFDVSEGTVLAWIHAGELRAINVGRTPGARKPRWRITRQALEDFEAARTATPAAPRPRRRRQREDVIEFYR
jgi:excisionase family DNA binding protein